jgi:YD repeat-containing protein
MNGNSKKAGRDAYGRLVTVLENNSGTYGTTTYAWNPNDTLATTTDADGSVRAFTYDGRGLRLPPRHGRCHVRHLDVLV